MSMNAAGPKKTRILVIDDEPAIRRALRLALGGLGFDIVEAARGEEALGLIRTAAFDLLLLDVNMPGLNGIEVCRMVRHLSARLPIVIVTVRDAHDDKVEALDAGADDYITKPFHVPELLARLRAVLRRSTRPSSPEGAPISIGEISLHLERRVVLKGGQPVRLTPKEFDLLSCLMLRPGMPVTRKHLLASVWGSDYRDEFEYLRTYVRQLRLKIEDDPANPRYLLTDACVGYRFRDAQPQGTEGLAGAC